VGGKHRGSNDKGHEADEENASVQELLDQAEANFLAGGARGGDETLAAAAIAASDTLEIVTFHTCHCFLFRSSAEKESKRRQASKVTWGTGASRTWEKRV